MKTSNRFRDPRPLVVCVHSSGASSRQWLPLADRLGDSFVVIAPDLFGHATAPGWTGDPKRILDADVERVAQVLAGRPGHLVGHSYGGAVALRTALRHPDRVQSVTAYEPVLFRLLRDFAPRSREAWEAADVAAGVRRDLVAGLFNQAALRFVDYWSGPGSYAALPETQRQSIARRMPAVAAHFSALWNEDAGLASYAGLRMPVAFLMGSRTRAATRRIVELLRYAIPHATYEVMPAMGHMGPVTHPITVAQRIAAQLWAHEPLEVAAMTALAA